LNGVVSNPATSAARGRSFAKTINPKHEQTRAGKRKLTDAALVRRRNLLNALKRLERFEL
jgi:hypothetical protein